MSGNNSQCCTDDLQPTAGQGRDDEKRSAFSRSLTTPFAAHDIVQRKDDPLGLPCRIVWIEESSSAVQAGGGSTDGEGSFSPEGTADEMVYMLDVPGEDDLVPSEGRGGEGLVRCFPKVRVAEAAYGLGVFASATIKKGEDILREKPLITATNDGEAEMTFYDLSTPTQMAVMGLNDPECCGDTDNDHLDHLDRLERNEEKTVGSIYRNNSIPNGREEGTHTGSLYEVICRLNHSCCPNVQWRWDKEKKEEIVFAIEDIPLGEELNVSYVHEYQPHEVRRAKLQKDFFFDCRCPLCKGYANADQEVRYERGMRLYQRLAEIRKRIDALPPPSCSSMSSSLLPPSNQRHHHKAGGSNEKRSKHGGHHTSAGGAPAFDLDAALWIVESLVAEGKELCHGEPHLFFEAIQLQRLADELRRWSGGDASP